MSAESKEIDSKAQEEVINKALTSQGSTKTDNDETDEEESTEATNADAIAATSSTKKKKSKKAKLKKAFGVGAKDDDSAEGSSSSSNPASKLTPGMVEQLLEMNPSLKSEVAGMNKDKAAEALKKLDVADLLTGMVIFFHANTIS